MNQGWRMVLSLAMASSGCENKSSSAAGSKVGDTGAAAAVAAPVVSPSKPEPSPLEVLRSKVTLADAIDQVKSKMSDTDDERSPGAALLGIWSSDHLKWADVAVAKNETSFALIRKDSDANRGKRMCLRGEIIQIEKEKAEGVSLFSGLILNGSGDITNFIAAGSTGALVAGSGARLCGVVIGTYEYSNSGGGKGHAISLVGMFDLPENHGGAH